MESHAEGGGRDVRIVKLRRPLSFRSPFDGMDFALLLADGLGASEEERAALAAEVVRQGCRYAVCAGLGCSNWEDAIDWAFIASSPEFAPPDERLVMTTSHPGEPGTDVVDWFLHSTAFDDFNPEKFLALILGESPEMEGAVRAVVDVAR